MGTCVEKIALWAKSREPAGNHIRLTGSSNTQAFIKCLPCDRYSSGYKVEDRVPVSVRTLPVTSHPNLIGSFFWLMQMEVER